MKARVCEFCAAVILESDQTATVFNVVIEVAGDYHATSDEAKLLLDHEACARCARRASQALKDLKAAIIRELETARAIQRTPLPPAGKRKAVKA